MLSTSRFTIISIIATATLLFVGLFFITPAYATTQAQTFNINDRVVSKNTLSVWSGSSVNGRLGTQLKGVEGTIVGGPFEAENLIWWKVDFDTAPDGWTAERWLEMATYSTDLPKAEPPEPAPVDVTPTPVPTPIDVTSPATEDYTITCHDVVPSVTDKAIDKWNTPHYICSPNSATVRKNKLFLFFPGTQATPQEYMELTKEAARKGFNAISLSYANEESLNFQLCPGASDACFENNRNEILYGEDTSLRTDVNVANSAIGRTEKLLAYAADKYSSEGWEQLPVLQNGDIEWQNVVVSGHSQGGGHAVFVSKTHPVDRVVIFAWADVVEGRLASWVTDDGVTPAKNYYLFWHLEDMPVANYEDELADALGIRALGQNVSVDSNNPPYEGTHTITTDLFVPGTWEQGDRLRPHNAIVIDDIIVQLPDGDGLDTYKDAWDYLFTANSVGDSSTPPPPPPTPVPSGKFQINGRVMTTENLSVRTEPITSIGSRLGVQLKGSLGTVVGGPINFLGYTWWKIDYDNATDGWSVETWLEDEGNTIPSVTHKFSPNDRVATTDVLAVRTEAKNAIGTKLGVQPKGSEGTVVVGPVAGGGYLWWKIDYDNAPDGWSAENWLEKALYNVNLPIETAP